MNVKRDSIWQTPHLREELARVRDKINRKDGREGAEQDELYAANSSDLRSQLEALALRVELLRAEAVDSALSASRLEARYRSCIQILNANGVDHRKSQLRWIYREIRSILAEGYRHRGQEWMATWYERLANFDGSESARSVTSALRDQNVLSVLEGLDDHQVNEPNRLRAIAQCLRLAGDPVGALAFLGGGDLETRWLKACCWSQVTGDTGAIAEFMRGIRRADRPPQWNQWVLEARLWAAADRKREALGLMPRSGRASDALIAPLHRLVSVIESCHDNRKPLWLRIERLGHAVDGISPSCPPPWAALFYSAGARWLHRSKQPQMMAMFLRRLKELSMTLSAGTSADVLGLATDIRDPGKVSSGHQPEYGWISRPAVYANMTWNLSRILGRRGIGRLLRGEMSADDLSSDQIVDLSRTLAEYLSRLKGPAMKLGQIASYSLSHLPSETQKCLSILQDDVPALNPKIVRSLVEREMGRSLDTVFETFDDRPLGTGSIGQVHGALLHDGREVAVKVQYPNIERALAVDFRMLRTLEPLLRILVPGLKLRPVIQEMETRLFEECDYLREVDSMTAFRRLHAGNPAMRIPQAVADLCTPRLIVMDRVRGLKFSEFNRVASQNERDEAGVAIVRFNVGSCARGVFNTDPHPGNYLFENGRVAFIDFGSVKVWNGPTTVAWADLIASAVYRDRNMFRSALCAMGLIANPSKYDFSHAYDLMVANVDGLWTLPRRQRLSQRVMEEQFASIFNSGDRALSSALPAEYLFGFRVYFGHVAVVAALGAEADWNRLVREVMGQRYHV